MATMTYGNPDNPHAVLELPHDVWLAPAGKDVFTVQPDEIKQLTVSIRYPGEAGQHPEVRKLAARGYYVIDAQAQGTLSPIVRAIHARARNEQNLDERRRWEDGANVALIRGVVGSRPLGG